MKRAHSFYSSAALLLLLNIIIKPIWIFAIDRKIQNEVGVEEYGLYFSLFNLANILNFALDIGLTNFSNRELASPHSILPQQLRKIISLKIVLATIYLVVLFIIAWFTNLERWDFLLKLAFIQIASSLFIFFRSIITANQWFRQDAWLSVIDKSILILIFGSFFSVPLLHQYVNIENFINWQLITMFIALTAALIVLRLKDVQFTRSSEPLALKAIVPYALLIFLMSAHTKLDAFLLVQLHPDGASEAGYYASAFRLLDASNMVIVLLCSFLLPYITRHRNDKEVLDQTILQSRHLLLFYAVTLSLVAIFNAAWLQQLLYHHQSHASLIAWTVPTLIGYAFTGIYGTLLTALGQIRIFIYVVMIGLFINLILNCALIGKYGAFACSWSALISQSVSGVMLFIYTSKKLKINFDLKAILIYIFTGLLIASLFIFLRSSTPIPVLILLSVFLSATISINTKLIVPSTWFNFLQPNK